MCACLDLFSMTTAEDKAGSAFEMKVIAHVLQAQGRTGITSAVVPAS